MAPVLAAEKAGWAPAGGESLLEPLRAAFEPIMIQTDQICDGIGYPVELRMGPETVVIDFPKRSVREPIPDEKFRYGFDDALDVVAVHLVGGIIGSILLGLFAEALVNPAGRDGVFFGGGWGLFGEQVLAVGVVFVFSFVISGIIGLGLSAVLPGKIRVTDEDEQLGLDLTQHSETAYALERA